MEWLQTLLDNSTTPVLTAFLLGLVTALSPCPLATNIAAIGYNQSAVTFIGQNYAAKKYDRCKKIYKVCMVESLIGILCMEAMFFIGRDQFISLYTTEKLVARLCKNRYSE